MVDRTRVSQLALWSIFIAFAVMGVKFIAWQISGSIALFSDALESIVNVVAAAIAWWTIRISLKPADTSHPFGHHKAEYFSAVIEGVLVVVAALLIFREAVPAILSDHHLEAPGAGMAVNAAAAAVNGFWAWLLISTGRRERSPALSADGQHILADVVTSVGVLIGLALAILTGWSILDPLMALVVGVNVLREGWKVIASSISGLMDSALDGTEIDLINKTILENSLGALEAHDIKTRTSGAVSFIEFHLVVDASMSVADSHVICDRLESALKTAVPGAVVTIHVEPDHKRKNSGVEIVPQK